MTDIMNMEELENRIEMLEFKQRLLFDNTEMDRLLFEYNITQSQNTALLNMMDEYRSKIEKGIDVNHHTFETEIYKIAPQVDGDYHFCEFLASGFMDARRWEEVFPKLYGDMPKHKNKINNNKSE